MTAKTLKVTVRCEAGHETELLLTRSQLRSKVRARCEKCDAVISFRWKGVRSG